MLIVLGAHATDLYPNFAALAAGEREGTDYHVDYKTRGSGVCVLAIHGGQIEDGSGQLARAIAGDELSYYVFVATKRRRNVDLHVTSVHFDDPRAIAVARSAERCVSIHGFKEDARDVVCVGGGDPSFRAFVAERLKISGLPIEVESPCERFGGATPANITNRARRGGVQVELSTHLRKTLMKDGELMTKVARRLRAAALEYKPSE